MEVFLGGISSLLYGGADFLGGEAARKVNPATAVLWAGVLSFPLMVMAAVAVGGTVSGADVALGIGAGSLGAFGLVSLFAGLSRGRAAVVAPLSASVGALVPVTVAVVIGERPSLLAWTGVALSVPAIALCASAGTGERASESGFWYGVAAGAGFGAYGALINFTSTGSNLWPLVASRGATMAAVAAVATIGWWGLDPPGRVPWKVVGANGISDAAANITLLLAFRAGSLALAATAASFYPAVTVLLAKVVNGEHLSRAQVAGLALTLAALVAIGAG